ncbi:BTAD domain-containing putative transcriptional regulator [Streptomyces sp. NBC_01408]|uniref:AfsR/SARP family transcriptional regulator n=1 Tax=Streptomyces sp. NBC_01408 TaxID=2903855 RepID=UPI00225194E3|nr:BTAD domain-containing putative transcriptional regulator [Streptomyces sp. NBC_01408]MCX4695755.1 SARP family transcriptional regulator [Streptomyces sp. NBC_01408]
MNPHPQFFESPVRVPGQGDAPALHLLGGPRVVHGGRRLDVPEGSKRLLAFVALHGGRVERRHAAGTLWPSGDDLRAAGNLRSALWRLKAAGIDLLDSDKCSLSVREHTVVDLYVLYGWASRLISGNAATEDLCALKWRTDALDLLPGWYDDWVLLERERVRQRLLHALEALSRQLSRVGRHAEAVESALVAVSAEPLRESAQRALIEAHLAEGNLVEALRGYDAYRGLTRRELGVEPGRELSSLIRRFCESARSPVRQGVAGRV